MKTGFPLAFTGFMKTKANFPVILAEFKAQSGGFILGLQICPPPSD